MRRNYTATSAVLRRLCGDIFTAHSNLADTAEVQPALTTASKASMSAQASLVTRSRTE
ncbi:MAG: hypothetical protein LBL45_12320 [Treponema sp.]|nr:hypothetical protein [Treponema sp.]